MLKHPKKLFQPANGVQSTHLLFEIHNKDAFICRLQYTTFNQAIFVCLTIRRSILHSIPSCPSVYLCLYFCLFHYLKLFTLFSFYIFISISLLVGLSSSLCLFDRLIVFYRSIHLSVCKYLFLPFFVYFFLFSSTHCSFLPTFIRFLPTHLSLSQSINHLTKKSIQV